MSGYSVHSTIRRRNDYPPSASLVTEPWHSLLDQLPTPPSLASVIAQAGIGGEMAALEQLLLERSASHSPLISAAGAYTIHAGGKRIRAALALLAAHLGSYDLANVIHAAAAAELIHAASLIHDDLVDQAELRRGHITVHARWDGDVALMTGDYFFALASNEMAQSADTRIISVYAQAVQTIVEGELSPVTIVQPFDTALNQYLYKTGCKTAILFEAACRAGMIAGKGDQTQIDALGRYGYDLGMAFQIVDDVLDFVSDTSTLGKPVGNDVRQGTITLPLIHAVARGGSHLLEHAVLSGAASDTEVTQVVAEVIALGGTAAAMSDARHYVASAIAALSTFPPSPYREALYAIAAFVVARTV